MSDLTMTPQGEKPKKRIPSRTGKHAEDEPNVLVTGRAVGPHQGDRKDVRPGNPLGDRAARRRLSS